MNKHLLWVSKKVWILPTDLIIFLSEADIFYEVGSVFHLSISV